MHALLVLRQFFFVCIFVSVYVPSFRPAGDLSVNCGLSLIMVAIIKQSTNLCNIDASDLLCSFEFRLYVVKSKFTDAFEKQLPRNIDPQLNHKADASGAQQTDATGDTQAQVACQAVTIAGAVAA